MQQPLLHHEPVVGDKAVLSIKADGLTVDTIDKDKLAKEEFIFLGNALTDGINSGFFDAIAHPDRIFRKCSTWTKEMSDISSEIIQAACDKDLPLEINISSKFQEHAFWNEFWELVPDTAKRIVGLDAHSVAELM